MRLKLELSNEAEKQFIKDIKSCFGEEMCKDQSLCRELWCSLANIYWRNQKFLGMQVGLSFRDAAHIIADIRRDDYMNWYGCGPYATIYPRIRKPLAHIGWKPITITYM